jgi:midasin
VRELEKLCTRVEGLLPANFHYASRMDVDENDGRHQMQALPLSTIFTNPSLKEDIFNEARDVFFGAGALTASARAHVEAVVSTVGSLFDFDSERQAWLISGRVHPFTEEMDANGRVVAVSAGHTRLVVKSSSSTHSEMDDLAQSLAGPRRPFAMHKPAIVLLSRIARVVSFSRPIFLTGETGPGKTSAVTHLAGLLRRKLVSLNLSHQTESGDLLGGFKPVDSRVPGSALMEPWGELFGDVQSEEE